MLRVRNIAARCFRPMIKNMPRPREVGWGLAYGARQCPSARQNSDNMSRAATKEPQSEPEPESEPETTITKCCPMCREISNINLDMNIFTDSPCSICFDTKPKIIFNGCKHANVCKECAVQL